MSALILSTILSTLLLAISVSNFILLRRAKETENIFKPSIAVLLPLRDEEQNLADLISTTKAQSGIDQITFHLINDNSSDQTYETAARLIAGDERFFLHQAPPLESGWLGKPAALHFGLINSESDLVVIVDADVRLTPDALQRALAVMQNSDLDFISVYPKQIAKTWSEYLIQPLLQWSWMSTVPLRIAEKSKRAALCVANGQFFVVRRLALGLVGDFSAVKSEVIDDISLARALVRAGHHGTVIDGSDLANCRMYSSWAQLRDGYGKSLHLAFGGVLGALVATIFLLTTGVLPVIALLFGSKIGLYCFFAVLISRLLSAISSGGSKWASLLHPVSIGLLLFLILRSWSHRKNAHWKGRPV